MKKNLLSFAILFLLFVSHTFAQIQTQANIALYMQNLSYYNPAFAGLNDAALNLSINSRNDWVPLKDLRSDPVYPISGLATLDKRFDEKNFGASINAYSSFTKAYKVVDLLGNFAYHLPLGGEKKLSFGMRAGFTNAYTPSKEAKESGDAAINTTNINTIIPKAGFGLVYKSERFFAGFSSNDLFAYDANSALYLKESVKLNSFKGKNLVLNAGYKLNLNEDYYLQPNAMVRITPGFDDKIDLSMIAGKTEAYWLGGIYSINNAVSAMGGMVISNRMKFSYAFSYITSNKSTSHDLSLTWDLEDLL